MEEMSYLEDMHIIAGYYGYSRVSVLSLVTSGNLWQSHLSKYYRWVLKDEIIFRA